MHPNIEKLRSIKTFNQLIAYLRAELDWPIESDDFDDLTFDYEPEELGIDAKTAVKIKEIKQLRPLVSNQPWGIFFINFEPKQLPIVVLRRILRSLVVTKRNSAAKAHQAAWSLHDLLFISSYGESERREITFAHFNEPADRLFGDLPTLRVLGWDDDDTKLKIDHVVYTLSEKMRWPEDENDTETWRRKWSDAFELRPREVITTSKELAIRLADLAKSIRQRANLILSVESERGPLRKLHKAFQTALIHDLKEDDFADMYAQTIAYGLLSEKLIPETKTFFVGSKGHRIVMNSFLSELLEQCRTVGKRSSIDFDELGIQEVVDLLNSPDTHMEAVLRDFNKRTMQEDPVIHFYELFLKEYDKKKKVERGVFYTPQPVVSYIVRSVHELMKTEFGLEDGLASTVTWGEMSKKFPPLGDGPRNNIPLHQGEGKGESGVTIPKGLSPDEPFVQILDPATGTATFLVEVIEVIFNTMTEKWKREGHMAIEMPGLWNNYVPEHLLPRLYGFELMMAPYAIAHMKIGLKLYETGYQFGSDERAHIYLTNSLEPPSDAAEQPQFEEMSPALAHEAKGVNFIKQYKYFTVAIGNPPYERDSINKGSFIENLMREYKNNLKNERNLQPLSDDYIKFIRFVQNLIEKNQIGIVGIVTNRSYLHGIIHREMRDSLMNTFKIHMLDLHGGTKPKETPPNGYEDKNVFDITMGVCIGLFTMHGKKSLARRIFYSEKWGLRTEKFDYLHANSVATIPWEIIEPNDSYNFFVKKNHDLRSEFFALGQSLPEIFPTNSSGIKTKRDHFVTDFDKISLRQRIANFRNGDYTESQLKASFGLKDLSEWKMMKRRESLKKDSTFENCFESYFYRPFDIKFIFYHSDMVARPCREVMQHLMSSKANFSLLCQRQTYGLPFYHVFITRYASDVNAISNLGGTVAFPLYLVIKKNIYDKSKKTISNLDKGFIQKFTENLSLGIIQNVNRDFSPEDLLFYVYAILSAPTYRTRYQDLLKIEFPRIPFISNGALFETLTKLGGGLVSLHLMESPKLDNHITRFVGNGAPVVEKISYSNETVWIDKAKSQCFKGVPENVWIFHIGGYQVCEKWLKDRKGRTLSADDINHYHRIVVALKESIRLMAEIDVVIDAHGGWPGAFMNKQEEGCKYKVDPEPLPKAAEEIPAYIPKRKDTAE